MRNILLSFILLSSSGIIAQNIRDTYSHPTVGSQNVNGKIIENIQFTLNASRVENYKPGSQTEKYYWFNGQIGVKYTCEKYAYEGKIYNLREVDEAIRPNEGQKFYNTEALPVVISFSDFFSTYSGSLPPSSPKSLKSEEFSRPVSYDHLKITNVKFSGGLTSASIEQNIKKFINLNKPVSEVSEPSNDPTKVVSNRSTSSNSNENNSSANSTSNTESSSGNTTSTGNSGQNKTQSQTEEDKMLESEYSEEAIAKKKEARDAETERRIAAAERENQQIQENTAAMGAAILVLGGFIYQNYGHLGEVYTGDNFLYGFEGGFGLTVDPEIFTIDLNLKPKFGYQRLIKFKGATLVDAIELGATFSPHATLGLRPDLAYQTSYALGGRVFGGFPSLKVFYDYENGARDFVLPEGSMSFANGYSSHKFGLQFSRYNGSKTLRNHFYLGLIRENVNGYGDSESGSFEPFTYNGYMFEWYKEHHGRLFIHWIPGYKTNPASPATEEEVYFVKAGFSRVIESFEPRSSNERKRRNEKGQKVKVNRDDAGFIMYTRDIQNYIGFSFGSLKKNKIGYYTNISGGSSTYDDISAAYDIENNGESNSIYHFTRTEKVEKATLFVASFGITKSIFYPLFAYAGLGLGYAEQYEEVREYETLARNTFDENAQNQLRYYHNIDEEGFRLFPEIGLKYKLFDRLILKYGISLRGDLINQIGIGIALY